MKNLLVNFVGFVCVITFLFCSISCNQQQKKSENETDLSGTINISGAFALYPMTVAWADSFMKIHKGVKINISAGGAGKGMTDVLTGLVDLGMFSRNVTDEEISKGAYFIAVTRDAVIPVVNSNNPVIDDLKSKGMKRSSFISLYIDEAKLSWGQVAGNTNTDKITVYTRSDACGAAEMWGKYLGSNQENLKGVGVFGDPGIADAVRKDKYSIGYNNVIYAYDFKTRKPYEGLFIVPVDLNENGVIDKSEDFYTCLDSIMLAIKENKYPSPPARDLYFISLGKPKNPVVIEFLKWILTDGQNMTEQAGYVILSKQQIENEISKIK